MLLISLLFWFIIHKEVIIISLFAGLAMLPIALIGIIIFFWRFGGYTYIAMEHDELISSDLTSIYK